MTAGQCRRIVGHMNNTNAISRAIKVIAANAAKRFEAGASSPDAVEGALREFSARWPHLGADVRKALSL